MPDHEGRNRPFVPWYRLKESPLSENVYKKIEIVGTSSKSIEDAVRNAVGRASKTVSNMRWFEVMEHRGRITDGEIDQWQVTIKIGFTLNE